MYNIQNATSERIRTYCVIFFRPMLLCKSRRKEIWKVFWQSCLCFRLFNYKHKHGVLQRPMLNAVFILIYRNELVYDRNHYFGLGPIPKPKPKPNPKPKLTDTFGRCRNRYRNYILKEESSYR